MSRNDRLKSYEFECPCCKEQHKRLFEYFAAFKGKIGDNEPLENFRDVSMLERVQINDGIYENRSLPVGDSTFRCGNCHEYFKFDEIDSIPRKLEKQELVEAQKKFKPISIDYETAVMNAVATFDSLINQYGCTYDKRNEKIVIQNDKGKKFEFDFARQLYEAFYKNNPSFAVRNEDEFIKEYQ